MSAAPGMAPIADGSPRTMKYCRTCQRETPHQISSGEGIVAVICLPCWFRAADYELERD